MSTDLDARLYLRIPREILHKIRYISDKERRSANNQILVYIDAAIAKYEQEHGPIPDPAVDTPD